MTKEEAIRQLMRLKIHSQSKQLDKDIEALKMAIKVLKQTKWISISERLPEKEGLYLVSVKNDHERRYSKTCWYMGRNHWFARQDVEAWMPLPQEYRAEKDGDEI